MKALLLTFALSVLSFVSVSTAPAATTTSTRYLDPTFNVAVQKDVSYGSVLNLSTFLVEDLTLDIYQPIGDVALQRPVVFWVHGGGFTDGDKDEMEYFCRYYASRGYVAIAPNYRLVSVWDRQNLGASYASSDTQAAVRWARENSFQFRLNTDKIALCGNSSGGYSVLGAAYDEGLRYHNPNWLTHESEVAAVAEVSGRLYNLDSMERGEPPCYIIHGMQDDRVPFSYALDLEQQAQSVGVEYDTLYFPQGGHTIMRTHTTTVLHAIRDYLYDEMILL
ncbi:MAG: alpha/beta hydrolase [Planctomycetota bacterium]